MSPRLTGAGRVAGVVGRPVGHSLSPRLHNAWIEAAGLNAAYVPFQPAEGGFARLVQGFRGGTVRGLNITLPYKEEALALADRATPAATSAGAANLLLFDTDDAVEAHNTDGIGLLAAFTEQAPEIDLSGGPVVILGAGGAARGALAALQAGGVETLRIVNRSPDRAAALAEGFRATAFSLDRASEAFDGAVAIINATSAGLGGSQAVDWPLSAAPETAAVMDMIYTPLHTPLLIAAALRGMLTVDGLGMLIGQARPSFEAFFGAPPPASVDARAVLMEVLR